MSLKTLLVYLVIFINNIRRDAFVNHFREDGRSRGAILPAGLLCQLHLVTFGAQWSLRVSETQDRGGNKSSELIRVAVKDTKQNNSHVAL